MITCRSQGMSPASYRPPLFSGLLGAWFRITGVATPLSAVVFQALVTTFAAWRSVRWIRNPTVQRAAMVGLAWHSFKGFLVYTQLDREWFGKIAGISMRWYIWIWPSILLQGPLYMGLLWSVLRRGRDFYVTLAFSFYMLYWLQYTMHVGLPRYSVPVYPILLVMGVYGLPSLAAKLRSL